MKNRSATDSKIIAGWILGAFFVVVLMALNFVTIYSQARDNLIRNCENDVLKESSEVSSFLVVSNDTVKMAAYTLSVMMGDGASQQELLDYLVKQSDVYIRMIDKNFTGLYGVFNGEYLDGVGWVPDDDFVPEERPWYTTAVEAHGGIALVTPYLDKQTGTIIMSICKLLSDGHSVLSLDIELNGIQELVEKKASQGYYDYVMVLDEKGVVVAHADEDQKGLDYSRDEGYGGMIYRGLKEADGNYYLVNIDGQTYYVFFADIESGWTVLTAVQKNKLLSGVNRIYLIFFISLIVVFTVIYLIFRQIRKKQAQAENVTRQLQAVVNIYFSVHLIDLPSDTFTELSGSESINSIIGEGNDKAQYKFRLAMDALADARFKAVMFDFIDFATLSQRLKGRNFITKEFISFQNERRIGRFIPVEWDEEGNLIKVIWMVEAAEGGGNGK